MRSAIALRRAVFGSQSTAFGKKIAKAIVAKKIT
jgi:hypothetical protein